MDPQLLPSSVAWIRRLLHDLEANRLSDCPADARTWIASARTTTGSAATEQVPAVRPPSVPPNAEGGGTWIECDGGPHCSAIAHVHGCYADDPCKHEATP